MAVFQISDYFQNQLFANQPVLIIRNLDTSGFKIPNVLNFNVKKIEVDKRKLYMVCSSDSQSYGLLVPLTYLAKHLVSCYVPGQLQICLEKNQSRFVIFSTCWKFSQSIPLTNPWLRCVIEKFEKQSNFNTATHPQSEGSDSPCL